MIFPTKSTFIIQGMMPGHTMLSFSPNKEKQKVVKILHDGQDILKSGIDTKPGQEIKEFTIVVGTGPATGSAGFVPPGDTHDAAKSPPGNGPPAGHR